MHYTIDGSFLNNIENFEDVREKKVNPNKNQQIALENQNLQISPEYVKVIQDYANNTLTSAFNKDNLSLVIKNLADMVNVLLRGIGDYNSKINNSIKKEDLQIIVSDLKEQINKLRDQLANQEIRLGELKKSIPQKNNDNFPFGILKDPINPKDFFPPRDPIDPKDVWAGKNGALPL